jgi:hypothetical protein
MLGARFPDLRPGGGSTRERHADFKFGAVVCAIPVFADIRHLLVSSQETMISSKNTHRSHDGPFPRIYLLVKVRSDVCTRVKMKVSADIWVSDFTSKEDSRRINATAANDDGFRSENNCLCRILEGENGAEAPCTMSVGIVHVHFGIGNRRWSSLVRTAEQ